MCGIVILVPSYGRPELLRLTLPSWIRARGVDLVMVLAQASSRDDEVRYIKMLEYLKVKGHGGKLSYVITRKPLGSAKARLFLLRMARERKCSYAVMAEDDMLLEDKNGLIIMSRILEKNEDIGLVGGKVVNIMRRRVDPEFYLNLPLNLADLLSKATGYVFIDEKHGPRYAEYVQQFFMIRCELLNHISYDVAFNTPTSFREETDLEEQIKALGYKIFYEPRIRVLHISVEKGGNRSFLDTCERIYWKIRNHTIYLFKWSRPYIARLWWYLIFSVGLLGVYRPWCIKRIIIGLRDGVRAARRYLL